MPPRPRLKLANPAAPVSICRAFAVQPPPPLLAAVSQPRQSPLRQLRGCIPRGRDYSTATTTSNNTAETEEEADLPPAPGSRWLSDLRARLGKCIIFGCSPEQISRAASVLQVLTTEWRSLTAGSEGFLTTTAPDQKGQRSRAGLDGHQVVWGEMDTFQHVNNVNYIRWAESARVNWVTHFAGLHPGDRDRWLELMTPRSTGLIMKSIKAEYKMPLTYPDRVSVFHKLRRKPGPRDTSLVLDAVVLSHRHRRVACRLEEDIVVYDYLAAGKTPVPGFALNVFREVFQRQLDETKRAREMVAGLTAQVEALEKETWNREDAVEDVGAAKK